MSLALWAESLKPKVYAASIAPVVIGTALAYADGNTSLSLVPLILACALLIQTISNWVNDIYDFKRGADERGRMGPRRLLVEGLLRPQQLVRASWIAATVCFFIGVPLILASGWPTLVIGLVCLVAAWAYTGGRYNMAYTGWGDVAAFLLFGVVGVSGTFYVLTSTLNPTVVVVSVGPGLLVANILGVNNLRDIPTDSLVGKKTLAVRLGATKARLLYAANTVVAFAVPPLVLFQQHGFWSLLPLVLIPIGVVLIRGVYVRNGAELNTMLAATSALYLVYAIMLSVGLFVSSATVQ